MANTVQGWAVSRAQLDRRKVGPASLIAQKTFVFSRFWRPGASGVEGGMPALKRVLTLALVGAALGFIIWSFLGQSAVSILFGSLGGSFTCKADVELGLQKFVQMQLYCALAGALAAPLGAWFVKRSLFKSKPAAGPSA